MVSHISDIAEKEQVFSMTLCLGIKNKPGASGQTSQKIHRVARKLEDDTPNGRETVRPETIRPLEIVEHGCTANSDNDASADDLDGHPRSSVMDPPLREAHPPKEH